MRVRRGFLHLGTVRAADRWSLARRVRSVCCRTDTGGVPRHCWKLPERNFSGTASPLGLWPLEMVLWHGGCNLCPVASWDGQLNEGSTNEEGHGTRLGKYSPYKACSKTDDRASDQHCRDRRSNFLRENSLRQGCHCTCHWPPRNWSVSKKWSRPLRIRWYPCGLCVRRCGRYNLPQPGLAGP